MRMRYAAIFSFEGNRKGYFAKQNSPFGFPLKGILRRRRNYFLKEQRTIYGSLFYNFSCN